MPKLVWDKLEERTYETGVDHGVLYIPDETGEYANGYVWNGLVSVSESPSGAEPSPQYADNIKYLNLVSAEEFSATIEAFTYPDEFGECDGTAEPAPGVFIGQQRRKTFGLSYRTKVGNGLSSDAGYKIHLVYGALAAPTEKAYNTVNDSPEAITFSWSLSTTPVEVPGGFQPTATLIIDSTKVGAAALRELEDLLYGSLTGEPMLPLPGDVIDLVGDATVVNG